MSLPGGGQMPDLRQFIPPRELSVRFFKFAFLVVALAINTKLVFDGFSYYLARRGLDGELESRKISSLEYLRVQARRERAFVIDTVETRCAQRRELAMFRILDATKRQELDKAYATSIKLKDELVFLIDRLKTDNALAGVVDLPALRDEVNKRTFRVANLEPLVKPVAAIQSSDPRFEEASKKVIEQLGGAAKSFVTQLAAQDRIRSETQSKLGKDGHHFKNIELLEARYKRLVDVRKQSKFKADDHDDVLSRYTTWIEALTGGTGDSSVFDETAYQLKGDSEQRLDKIECEHFEKYFVTVNGRPIKPEHLLVARKSNEPDESKSAEPKSTELKPGPPSAPSPGLGDWIKSGWDDAWAFYYKAVEAFFNSPPVAQTLFVTLVLGALGALTINALRLSKIGWWGSQRDPLWGELLLSPSLGALAAFGIFLLGSAGLLLTGDVKPGGSGTTSLSPFFIGTLGFISGLLYDEAFGRVRRFGATFFAGDSPVVVVSAEDRSLAEVLRNAKASFVADLVLKFGIGKRISAEPEFTLLVPSDEARAGSRFSPGRRSASRRRARASRTGFAVTMP